jgi:hypothetical protein
MDDEMSILKGRCDISHSSSISSLNPVLGEDDTLCVGGRIKQAPIPYVKRPLILQSPMEL